MKNCVNCEDFDRFYKGGWCNYFKCTTSPYSSCHLAGDNGGGFEKYQCSTCYWHKNGWCEKHKIYVYSSSGCNDWVD